MIVLPVTAGAVVTVTAVWFVWSARRLWLYTQPAPQRTTVTATVVRPIPSPRELPGRPAPAILSGPAIRGEVEPPRQVYGTTYEHQERERRKHQR
jgi:hypothetical protein